MFDSERGGLFPPTRRVARRRSRIFLPRDGQTHAEFGVIVVVVSIVANQFSLRSAARPSACFPQPPPVSSGVPLKPSSVKV
jgi:hypothetical protein